ncbi:MAG TPA: hypothetical protein VJ884_05850, partial [Salinibacter sp.]|nr:hypothetical protein [Salinibacter sp.]
MSTVPTRLLCTVFILAWVLPYNSFAQEDDDPQETQQQLPEIAPREIEIRGELQLSFPSLERQPLRGFASPATIPAVPADRTPYADTYKQELDDLPDSLPAPETVSQSVNTPKSPKQGLLEIGGGRYVSRFVKGRVSLPLSSRQRLSIRTDYVGTNGFSPYEGTDVETPADDLTGTVQFESRHETLTVLADVHGTVDRYTLYGLPAAAQDTAATAPDRTAYTGGLGLQLRTHGQVESSVRLGYDRMRYETQLDPTDPGSDAAFREGRFSLDGSATIPVAGTEAVLSASASRSAFSGAPSSSSAYTVDAGGAFQVLNTETFTVRAGGRFLGFESPAFPSLNASSTASATFIAPEVRAALSVTPSLTLHAENTPGLSGSSLSTLYTENPYAQHAPSPRPTLYTTNAEAGLSLSLGPVRLQSSGGYRYAPSYRFFTAPSSPTRVGFRTGYGSARILHGGAELALLGIQGMEATAGISVRDGTLVGDDDAIPYF